MTELQETKYWSKELRKAAIALKKCKNPKLYRLRFNEYLITRYRLKAIFDKIADSYDSFVGDIDYNKL